MYSFYVFEGSSWQGGGGWEHLEVCRSLQELDVSVAYYVRTGSWAAGGTFVIRVYRHGVLLVERELEPFLTVKVPGLTTMRSTDDMRASGGLPEPGGRYDGMDEGAIWDVLPQDIHETALDAPEDIQVSVDWAGLDLPELVSPVLPPGVGVVLDGRELRYGRNSTLDGCVQGNRPMSARSVVGTRHAGQARHFCTLWALGEHGPLSRRQLMDLQNVDKSAMVRIIDDLERAGLVQRRPHPHDRRAHEVHLTATGRRRLAKASGVAAAVDEQLIGELAREDQAQLCDMLQTVITSAGHAKSQLRPP